MVDVREKVMYFISICRSVFVFCSGEQIIMYFKLSTRSLKDLTRKKISRNSNLMQKIEMV